MFYWSFSCLLLNLGICMLSKIVHALYGNRQGLEKCLKIKRARDLSVSGSCHPLSKFWWCNWYLRRHYNQWAEIRWLWVVGWMLSYSSQVGNVSEHFWSGLLCWLQEYYSVCISSIHRMKTTTSQLFCIIENCIHKLLFSKQSNFGLHFYHFWTI